ncbi:hypothetical protein IGI04_029612 [Brassica rapa subsp. trilocularis]|uniref:Uncharacterized protein n=1 Tax=Brassica rapa subsp. trilocularis TaxID=1813537 RepID=A0ABQ7LS96_BRACM|nr:hypothetical protein IGI04_029612 [Brassica rapa subsp. trilocularis]
MFGAHPEAILIMGPEVAAARVDSETTRPSEETEVRTWEGSTGKHHFIGNWWNERDDWVALGNLTAYPEEGIRFRGLSIPECQKVLPAAQSGGEHCPRVPSKEQVEALSKDMANRAAVPDYVYNAIDALPSTAHPMTQFASGVMALQV